MLLRPTPHRPTGGIQWLDHIVSFHSQHPKTVIVSAAWQRITTASWLVYHPDGSHCGGSLVITGAVVVNRQHGTTKNASKRQCSCSFEILKSILVLVLVSFWVSHFCSGSVWQNLRASRNVRQLRQTTHEFIKVASESYSFQISCVYVQQLLPRSYCLYSFSFSFTLNDTFLFQFYCRFRVDLFSVDVKFVLVFVMRENTATLGGLASAINRMFVWAYRQHSSETSYDIEHLSTTKIPPHQ